MEEHRDQKAAELAQNVLFIKWVKDRDSNIELNVYWRNWLSNNPDKQEIFEEARAMVLAVLEEEQYDLPTGKQKELWNRIYESTQAEAEDKVKFLWKPWRRWAAVVFILCIALWGGLRLSNKKQIHQSSSAESHNLISQHNTSSTPKTVLLVDGSSIILQPGSKLKYPNQFVADRREVYLEGEAFFEVSRDPSKPFLVHSNEIVTRVLGTSFIVRNFESEREIRVQVKSGKVSVFRSSEEAHETLNDTSDPVVHGVVLTPNQQVVYERKAMRLTKSLVENPAVLTPIAKQDFEFHDAPIHEVFKSIEEAYGVTIVYDEQALVNCSLNASLNDITLYEKLKLICKTINATYQIMDSQIIVYGKGCTE
ncbi:FecR family protein [Chryseosolibacter indicus]|uniref:FecR domain-containing protein n=1 Tax=Chryseosolibacter indicus TaxID=2782351 RepID=A0ABS5VUR6_9BACT|nr:FecR family protein [Chryseosolibacter indicus]MBT1705168.1 FecR domain-containing protein [Chryseosolibacter indicus]